MDTTIQPRAASLAPWQAWGILIVLSLIWGTSYILIKRGLVYFDPMQLAGIRLGVSALAFSPILIQALRRVRWSQLPTLALVGLLGTGLPSVLFPMAQQHIDSSLAGILNSLTPLFTLVLGLLFFRTSFSKYKALGVVVGLLGAVSLFAFGEKSGLSGNWAYGALIVLACLCYAGSSNIVGHRLSGLKALTISSISFSLMGIPALIYVFVGTDFVHVLRTVPHAWEGLGYVTILALFSTVLAGVVFFQLIQWTSPVFGSTVSYLVPVVAMGWGVLDGEVISVVHYLGMALILLGVYLTKKG